MGGRGAWTPIGKDNLTRQYTYVVGKPLDGSNKTKSAAHYAVFLGVKAIQNEINKQKLTTVPLVADGLYGAKSAVGVKEAQIKLGLSGDGKAGAVTCKKLWRVPIQLAAALSSIDPKYLYAFMSGESSGDPGATGWVNEYDHGLTQINVQAHPEVSVEQAHEVKFNLEYTANRFKQAMLKYTSNPARQVNAAILQHNNPTSAASYFKTGVYPNIKGEVYVESVLGYTDDW